MPDDIKQDDYLRTFTGKRFHMLGDDPDEIDIMDIAHALSHVNRFTGHTTHPYSVAAHSIFVADIVDHLYGFNPERMLAALMHDASEAYLADIASPIKHLLPDYQALEKLYAGDTQAAIRLLRAHAAA